MKRFTLRNEVLPQLMESAQDGIVVAEGVLSANLTA